MYLFFLWAYSFIVAIPTIACLITLQSSWLNFKVNISDKIREQEEAYNNRDEYMSTSGAWPVSEYTWVYSEYKIASTMLLALNDQLGNF